MVYQPSDLDVDKRNPLYHGKEESNRINVCLETKFVFCELESFIFFNVYIFKCVLQMSAQAEAENQRALRQTVLPQLSWLT